MRVKVCLLALLVFNWVISPAVLADVGATITMQDLMREIRQMRTDYESKISELQTQIIELKQSQKQEIAQVEKKVDKKLLNVEYVGRDAHADHHKGGLVMETPSGMGKVSLGGYADIELENFQSDTAEFDQHRFVLNVGAEIGERLKFFSEYEIEHGGPDAAGGGEAKVEQAWIDFLIHDAINFRAGAVLMPFGRYNIYHDSDLNDLTDRPLLQRDVIPTTWTEAGAGFHGYFNPTIGEYEDLEITYETYVVNGLNSSFSDTGLRGARGSLGDDNNSSKAFVGRVTASPAIGHEVGMSGYWGRFNREGDDIKGIGFDFLTTWGPWEFIGEWAYFGAQESGRDSSIAEQDLANHFTGLYLQAGYHFWFDFLNDTFLGKSFDNPTFTLVGRYGWVSIDDDVDASIGDNDEQRFTLGINYRPVESWVLKLEYQNNSTNVEALERGNSEGWIASVAMGF